MYSGPIKAGEVWRTTSRKGCLTIRVLVDIPDQAVDGFFEGEIIKGRATYMSAENNVFQEVHGQGMPGATIQFRTGLCHFIAKVEP